MVLRLAVCRAKRNSTSGYFKVSTHFNHRSSAWCAGSAQTPDVSDASTALDVGGVGNKEKLRLEDVRFLLDDVLVKVVQILSEEKRKLTRVCNLSPDQTDHCPSSAAQHSSETCDQNGTICSEPTASVQNAAGDKLSAGSSPKAFDVVRNNDKSSDPAQYLESSNVRPESPNRYDVSDVQDTVCSDRSEVEVVRGGEPGEAAASVNTSHDWPAVASPSDKPSTLVLPRGDESAAPLPLLDVSGPASPGIDIPDKMASPAMDQAIENMKIDFPATSECPVLNADEVESLLEAPDPPPAPNCVLRPVVESPFIPVPVSAPCGPTSFLPSPAARQLLRPEQAKLSPTLPPSPCLNNVNMPPLHLGRAFPLIGARNVSPATIGPTYIGAPHSPFYPRHNVPSALTSTPVHPSGSIKTNNHVVSPLTYSVRVTMTMTGVTADSVLACGSSGFVSPERMPRFAAPQATQQKLRMPCRPLRTHPPPAPTPPPPLDVRPSPAVVPAPPSQAVIYAFAWRVYFKACLGIGEAIFFVYERELYVRISTR